MKGRNHCIEGGIEGSVKGQVNAQSQLPPAKRRLGLGILRPQDSRCPHQSTSTLRLVGRPHIFASLGQDLHCITSMDKKEEEKEKKKPTRISGKYSEENILTH